MKNYIFDPQLQYYLSVKSVSYIDGNVLRKYDWLNCHCLTEYINLIFHLWKIRGFFWYLPWGQRALWKRWSLAPHNTWYSILFLLFFKQNIIFLLIPLPFASFNGINRQINLSKLLRWLQGYLFYLVALGSFRPVVLALYKHWVWWEILMWEELTGCVKGRTQAAA